MHYSGPLPTSGRSASGQRDVAGKRIISNEQGLGTIRSDFPAAEAKFSASGKYVDRETKIIFGLAFAR
jgi:hypothetical protein